MLIPYGTTEYVSHMAQLKNDEKKRRMDHFRVNIHESKCDSCFQIKKGYMLRCEHHVCYECIIDHLIDINKLVSHKVNFMTSLCMKQHTCFHCDTQFKLSKQKKNADFRDKIIDKINHFFDHECMLLLKSFE
jgi:hypothetical protein